MSSRNLHSPKYLALRRKKIVTFLFLFALCLLTLTASGILLLRAPFLQVSTVEVISSGFPPDQEIQTAVFTALSGSYLHIIPHTSIAFLPKNIIKAALKEKFKGVDDFSIHRSGFSKITISLTERKPAAIVCSGFRDETSSDACFWSDRHGFIFGPAATSTELNHYYIPSADTLGPGTTFIEEKRFNELEGFIKGALKGGLAPLGVLIGDKGEYEMYIKNRKSDSEVTVYFDDRAPFESTLTNLLTFWQNTVTNKKATTTPAFDYINLRFGNTVYYSTQ